MMLDKQIDKNIETGKRIKTLREQKRLTLEQVGEHVGVSKATIQRYETGEIDIKRNIAVKLSEVLSTTPSYIMGWTDIKDNNFNKQNKQIGERIEQRRKSLNLTLDDIAVQVGVTKSTIQRYEKGTISKIKLPIIESIAKALNVNPAWLAGKSEIIEVFQNNPTTSLDDGIEKVIAMYKSLSPENQSKFLELCNLYLTSFPPGDKNQ